MFTRKNPLDLEACLNLEDVVTCLPVVQEVLQGFRDESAYRLAHGALTQFPIYENPLTLEVVVEAANLYRLARRKGLTIRSSTDCLISVCALRNDLEVVHRDRDYVSLATVCGLRQRLL